MLARLFTGVIPVVAVAVAEWFTALKAGLAAKAAGRASSLTVLSPTWATSAARYGYEVAVRATSPVAYWRLGDSAGPTAVDEMGSSPGSYVNSPTLGVAGMVGDSNTAVTLNGTTQHILVPDTVQSRVGNVFSLSVWVNRTVDGVLLYGNVASSYSMDITAGLLRAVQDSVSVICSSTISVPSGTPVMLGWSRSGNGADKLYINGADVTGSVTSVGPIVNSANIVIGSTGFSAWLAGTVDEVAIWNRALTPAEWATLYAARIAS